MNERTEANEEEMEHEKQRNDSDKAPILTTGLAIELSMKKVFQGFCVDFGLQHTVVGLSQAKAYCCKLGRRIKPESSK